MEIFKDNYYRVYVIFEFSQKAVISKQTNAQNELIDFYKKQGFCVFKEKPRKLTINNKIIKIDLL